MSFFFYSERVTESCFFNPFLSSPLIGLFRPFTFNIIFGTLELNPDIVFRVFVFLLWFVSVSFFLSSCGLLEHFLEFHIDLSVLFEYIFFITFLVLALGFTFFVHNLSESPGIVILPV